MDSKRLMMGCVFGPLINGHISETLKLKSGIATLGTTPAVPARLEEKPWSLERVVEMTDAYWQPTFETTKAQKAAARRAAEDAVFQKALAGLC